MNGYLGKRTDEIRVHADADPDGDSNNEWQLSVTQPTGRHKDYRSSGRMACAIIPEFSDPSSSDPYFEVRPEVLTGIAYSGKPIEKENMSDPGAHDAALNRYNGSSHGLGEWAKVERPPGSTIKLKAHSAADFTADQGIQGGAHRFGFRTSDRVHGPIAPGPNEDSFTVYSNGDQEEKLVRVDKALCYLTKVQGEFDGAGEYVSISQEEYHWHLKVGAVCHSGWARWINQNNCDRKEIKAKARCYYYDH